MIQTCLTQDTHEVWISLCQQQNKSTHILLRELIEKYCREQLEKKRYAGATVLQTLGSR
jgi:hypothetical protein